MARPLTILHLADSHIGADLPGRPRANRPRRGDDFVRSYRRVLERAREHDVDLVLHAGDVFDRPDPCGAAVAAAAEPLLELAAEGFPIVIVPGNHERSALPGSLLFSHPNMHIVREPCTHTFNLRGRRVAVASLPCVRRGVAESFQADLEETGWSRAAADVNILLLHQTFESATCGPGNFRFRSGPDVIERQWAPRDFHYVALGHIHRVQTLESTLAAGPPIVYAGSPDRISFAERDEPKGCMLVSERDGTLAHKFLEHEVRPMAAAPIDVSGLTRRRIEQAVFAGIQALPPGAVAMLRLTGETTRREFRGLSLAARGAALRPDVLLTVSMQAVEFVPERTFRRGVGGRRASAFESLPPIFGRLAMRTIEEVGELPDTCGTYALRDSGGRLLYVGKAKRVRTRVRSHLRNGNAAEFFAGWTRQIASVEVRPACGDLEALLVEAELVRRLRPPFNRQMRSWSRYAYLVRNGRPHEQLSVCVEPPETGRCFGPYRGRALAAEVRECLASFHGLALCPETERRRSPSLFASASDGAALCERFFDGLCTGPCAGRITAAEYARRVAACDALLAGRDEQSVLAAESEVERRVAAGGQDAETRALARQAQMLRAAFDHGAVLRAARTLLGGLLILPGEGSRRALALLDPRGVRFVALEPTEQSARSALACHRKTPADAPAGDVLPKAVADVFCTIVRHLARHPGDATAVTGAAAPALQAAELVRLALAADSASAPADAWESGGLR